VNKIKWQDGPHTSRYGRVGPLSVFVISWRSTRSDPNWVMQCSLPGLEGERWKNDDEAELHKQAANVLDEWLLKVFGILPARAAYADRAFEAYAERAEIGDYQRPLSREAFDAGFLARANQVKS
jgi:hypothetical protein